MLLMACGHRIITLVSGQRYANNPLLGLNAIFKRLDQNHSGKVDRTEFLQLCSILDFNGSTDLMNALFSRYDLDRRTRLSTGVP